MVTFDSSQDEDVVIVVIGVSLPEPDRPILTNVETQVNVAVNREMGHPFKRDTVSLSTGGVPSDTHSVLLGDKAIHIQQYDISTGKIGLIQDEIMMLQNVVSSVVENNDFDITGVATKTISKS